VVDDARSVGGSLKDDDVASNSLVVFFLSSLSTRFSHLETVSCAITQTRYNVASFNSLKSLEIDFVDISLRK